MSEISLDLSQNEETSPAHFSRYGKHFQEKIFQALLTDHRWSSQMIEVMAPTFFELR